MFDQVERIDHDDYVIFEIFVIVLTPANICSIFYFKALITELFAIQAFCVHTHGNLFVDYRMIKFTILKEKIKEKHFFFIWLNGRTKLPSNLLEYIRPTAIIDISKEELTLYQYLKPNLANLNNRSSPFGDYKLITEMGL
ncbi:hypothetical protein BpHYR1_013822 [Brachionus plicatilis]|uniref:Uncharacterized protein n=1 Tax=Brachionus plicatilis TaxID=10195 RepID=A0A3M7SWQ7_BRAPC|nr:hypothetical protein BpHYR1_013822 [Brachionus plicatilis]